jgi:hypothetical protein
MTKRNPFIDNILQEVLSERPQVRLNEQEPEQQETPKDTPLPTTGEENAPIEVEGEESESIELFVPSPDSLGEIDDYKFADVLNRFRASPSFTEGETRNEFDSFWESFQPNERYFIYLAMLGFTQIALKGAKAIEAVHPNNYGLNIKARGDEGSEEVVDGGLLPADKATEKPIDRIAPIVVGESGRSKKWRQANAMRLQRNHED